MNVLGPQGGVISSTVVPQTQAVFPEGALTKNIKVGLQVSWWEDDGVGGDGEGGWEDDGVGGNGEGGWEDDGVGGDGEGGLG